MAKEKFIYNRHTLQFEHVKVPLKTKLLRAFGFVSAVGVTATLFLAAAYSFFPSPQEKSLQRELESKEYELGKLNNQIQMLGDVLTKLKERDGSVYRVLTGMNPIDEDVWNGGIGGHNPYMHLTNTSEMLISTKQRADKLARQMAVISTSLDTIQALAKSKDKELACLPTIKPVREDKLSKNVKLLSGFGWRVHPIFKRVRMHTGIDFTAPKGTDIQATGDGIVKEVKSDRRGYGLHVVIDHGYGYQSLYGHMNSIDVKAGQKVKRGQKIGEIGNTGTSTAPHCHYEIIYKGEKINPIQFVMDGLTPEEYQELVKTAAVENQSFD
ncbi:MAG: M23 family metallopeptidase [Saprospiraceae bacterium]|nr:M23 family metallopeptidase [Saprospiraceae bacterium]